jgi:hypothetical protein
MPTNRDLKRLVRVRMKKTGEAYTAARTQILRKKPALQAVPPKAQKTHEYSELAGMRDDAVKEKTGRTWAAWVRTLDRAGAPEWPHGKIARYVHEAFGVPGWWSQTVTVGYERIKGLRAIGQRMDGSFEASKSRTFSVPVARLYRAWKDARVRSKWLPGVALTVRKAVPEKSMRITWPGGTSVEAWFVSKGAAKSQVALAHTRLGSKADADDRKAYWDDRLRALGEALTTREK